MTPAPQDVLVISESFWGPWTVRAPWDGAALLQEGSVPLCNRGGRDRCSHHVMEVQVTLPVWAMRH